MPCGSQRPLDVVVTDFDLTLTGHGSTLAASASVLARVAEAGLCVGLASGRTIHNLAEIFRGERVAFGLPYPRFVIARENFVYWVRDGHAEPDEAWNRQRKAFLDGVYRRLAARLGDAFAALCEAGLSWQTWNLFSDYGLEYFFETPELAERARLVLEEVFRPLTDVRVQRNYWGTNVVAREGGKGYALRHVAEAMGVPTGRVLAIGDSLNDLDMLDGRYGFLPAAVGNADEKIKEAVRQAGGFVARQPTGQGVAEILEALLAPASRGHAP